MRSKGHRFTERPHASDKPGGKAGRKLAMRRLRRRQQYKRDLVRAALDLGLDEIDPSFAELLRRET